MKDNHLVKYNTVKRLIDDISYELDPDLINYLNEYFQNNFLYMLDKNVTFEYRLVIDTNIVISNLISYYKNGNSLLHKIIKQPLLKLCAPNALLVELNDKLPYICKDRKLDEEVINRTLNDDILPNIVIYDKLADEYYDYANALLQVRDVKDVPFLALSMEIKSHGIISQDKDFEEQPIIKIWQLKESQKVITIINKGVLCFYVQAQSLNLILKIGYEMSVLLISVLANITAIIIKYMKISITTIGENAKKIPLWIYTLIGLCLLYIISKKEYRTIGSKIMSDIMNDISNTFMGLYNNLKSFIVYMTPYVEPIIEYSLLGTVIMLENTTEMFEQLKRLEHIQ